MKNWVRLGTLEDEWSCGVGYVNSQANLDLDWLAVPHLWKFLRWAWNEMAHHAWLYCYAGCVLELRDAVCCIVGPEASFSLTNLVSKVPPCLALPCPGPWEAVWQSVLTSQKLKEMKLHGCLCVDNTFWALTDSCDRAGIGLPVAQVANWGASES